MNGKNRRSNYNRRSKGWSAELCYTNENSQIIKTHPNENYVQYQTTRAHDGATQSCRVGPVPPPPPSAPSLARGPNTMRAAAAALLICIVAVVSAEDSPTGLHLASSDSKVVFGPNSECTIQLKHDGGSTYLASSCPIETAASETSEAPAANPPLTCDQVAFDPPIPISEQTTLTLECGKYNCVPNSNGGCSPCDSFSVTCLYGGCIYEECSAMAHCTINDSSNPTGCASCTSITPTDVSDCSSMACGWDGTSTTCSACTALQATDQAACEAYGCTKSVTNTNPSGGEVTHQAADGYCIGVSYGIPPSA